MDNSNLSRCKKCDRPKRQISHKNIPKGKICSLCKDIVPPSMRQFDYILPKLVDAIKADQKLIDEINNTHSQREKYEITALLVKCKNQLFSDFIIENMLPAEYREISNMSLELNNDDLQVTILAENCIFHGHITFYEWENERLSTIV